MRNKFALILAFASFLLVAALGGAFAGAEPLSQGSVADPATTTTTVPSLQAPACANGLDDDGDGLVDDLDPDCETPADANEAPEAAAPAQPTEAEVNPQPAPEPSPAPADVEGGVKQGTGIGNSPAGKDGVTLNQELDNPSDGSRNGAVTAPSANGGGDQPAPDADDGGSHYSAGGTPTAGNPTTTIAPFGPAPIGVPNFVIDSFEIPPFLLPIYQACGTEYGIPWEVLASINKIETGFGTNLNVSSAGAVGWMQFLPSSWEAFGLDANGDGRKDPYNPVDAICAAAHYLKLAGGNDDLYQAIFAYNHADWYVQEVLLYARAYGRIPSDLVGSLTGLTEGAHFPIAADARYADDVAAREALKKGESPDYGNAAEVISSSPTPRGINIFSKEGAPVVAVNDGVVRKLGHSDRLGNFVVLEDTYGNRYTYAELGDLVRDRRLVVMPTGQEKRVPVESQNLRPRLRALPSRTDSVRETASDAVEAAIDASGEGSLKVGAKVIAGTVLARVAAGEEGVDSHINFSIRPAGKGAPRIDPKPILDGWKLLEATAIYRAKGKSPFAELSGAGVLLLSKEALQKRVLADKGLEIYECGREDIATGRIDRRILAMLEYLSTSGFRLTITSLQCGHGYLTASGNVSEHTTGTAVDIAAINGIPVTGHQGPGTPADELIHEVLRLQGTMHPHQVISLEDLPGEASFAMADHYDHVHVGYHPTASAKEARFAALLKPAQWQRLINRLGEIENPDVPVRPSKYSLPDKANGGLSAGSGD
ncbi:MAG TPA: lytic murein transglycosylase [Solirubrobacterales bacterium]|nr:lytic murein transglycosylase [Solirubrobacterales bacterium]